MDWSKLVSWWPTNRGNPKVQAGVLIVVVLLLFGAATRCHAADNSYMQVGVGSAIVRGPTSVVDLAVVWPDAGPRDAAYEIGTTFIGDSTLNGQRQKNNFAWRAGIIDGFGRFDVGLGIAILQNSDTYNSGRMNYTLSLAYRVKTIPITLCYRHFSNGGTSSPNKGRDMIYAAWRFE